MFTQEIVDFTNRWMFDLYGDQIGSHAVEKNDIKTLQFAKDHKAEIIEYLKARNNIYGLFPGLDELEKNADDWEHYYVKMRESLENGGIDYPGHPEHDFEYYTKKYPEAYGYFQAQKYSESDNYVKAAIGGQAKVKLMNGEPAADVIPAMEAEWFGYIDNDRR